MAVERCFICKVELEFNQVHGFYKCPDCGGEWWPGPPEYGHINLWEDEQRYKKSISKQGSGSQQSKRKRKEKPGCRVMSERYRIDV